MKTLQSAHGIVRPRARLTPVPKVRKYSSTEFQTHSGRRLKGTHHAENVSNLVKFF